jgi:hypothetical protein
VALFGLDGGIGAGPLYQCGDGSQVEHSADCPEGQPTGTMTTAEQLQAEIDALYAYTGAGGSGGGAGQSPSMPRGSTPAPGVNTGMGWGAFALVVGGMAFVLMMARR